MSSIVKVIEPSGILDGTKAGQLRQEVSNIVETGVDILLVDLKEVTFVDSSGLGALVSILKMVRVAGGRLFICSVNEQVRLLFELTSMDRVFKTFASRDEFNSAVLSPK